MLTTCSHVRFDTETVLLRSIQKSLYNLFFSFVCSLFPPRLTCPLLLFAKTFSSAITEKSEFMYVSLPLPRVSHTLSQRINAERETGAMVSLSRTTVMCYTCINCCAPSVLCSRTLHSTKSKITFGCTAHGEHWHVCFLRSIAAQIAYLVFLFYFFGRTSLYTRRNGDP